MNIIVHLSIASQTYQVVRKRTGTCFVLPFFMLGSILPDLDRRMSKIPHEIDVTLPLVENIVTKISSQFCENTILDRVTKSLQLGIICHFISDYFCHAHTNRFRGSIFQHHVYEFRMMWHIKRLKRYIYNFNQDVLENISSEDVFVYLEHMQVLYLSGQADFIADLTYAVNCASVLIESLAKRARQSIPNALAIDA